MTKIKLFAGTDTGLRDNNEDNFIVCPDLKADYWTLPSNPSMELPLSSSGCLLVVADGMGGMNAGEVASEIAIKTCQQMFKPSRLPANVTKHPSAIKAYLQQVVAEADRRIKQHCQANPDTEGMGSTIVMAWLLGGRAYVSWLGDSRAYAYLSGRGIKRLSKDHSYVQQLVDAKIITNEEALSHPQSNIITRSLGDNSQAAKADVIIHDMNSGEILLLCSDGLSGSLNDDAIAEILAEPNADLTYLKKRLTDAAIDAGSNDNITIALLQLTELDEADKKQHPNLIKSIKSYWPDILTIAVAAMLLIGLTYAGMNMFREGGSTLVVDVDSTSIEPTYNNAELPPSVNAPVGEGSVPGTIDNPPDSTSNVRTVIEAIAANGTLDSTSLNVNEEVSDEAPTEQ